MTAATPPIDFQERLRRRWAEWQRERRRRNVAKSKGGANDRLATLLTLLLVGLLATFAVSLRYLAVGADGRSLRLDELAGLSNAHRVVTATFLDYDNLIVGTFQEEPVIAVDPARSANAPEISSPLTPPAGHGHFRVAYTKNNASFQSLNAMLTGGGAHVNVEPQQLKSDVFLATVYLLPLLILGTFFGLLFAGSRGSGSGIGEVVTFGSVGDKRRRRGAARVVTFADVGSAEEAITELREVVDYLVNPARYDEIGAVPPKGVLLFGPPGCGKTLLAKAVAGEAQVPFFAVAGAEFVESLVGVGAARVRDLFARVRAAAPAIVFIDELDAAGRRRGAGGGEGGSDEREQTLNQMLVEMDGFDVASGVVVIGATNRPDILDPALLRPGRFDRHVVVETPPEHGRADILRLHARDKPLADGVDLDYIAHRTPGFSGADLASVINEAALLSLREARGEIETRDLEEAIQRVLHGPKRRGKVLSEEEVARAAIHEAGHAIVAAATGHSADVHRISVLARGKSVGSTDIQSKSDSTLLTRSDLIGRMATSLAGREAEALMLGEPSTGSEDDLEEATALARDMVGRFGMSADLGPMRLLASDADRFLGGGAAMASVSPALHQRFDAEVAAVIEEGRVTSSGLLELNRAVVEAIGEELRAHETLEGGALQELLAKVSRPHSSNGHGPERASRRGSRPPSTDIKKSPVRTGQGEK